MTEFLYNAIGEVETKVTYTTLCLITCAISFCLFVGLIHYEMNMNERKRTLINKIYLMLLSYVVAILVSSNFLDIARALYGPLPMMICKLYTASVQGFSSTLCACLIEAIVIKYIYCCILKNFGGFDDYFYFNYFRILNGTIFIYMTSIMFYSGITSSGPIAKCCACDPELVLQPLVYQSPLPFPMYVLWLVLLIHIVLQWKIRTAEISLLTCRPTIKSILSGWINIIIFFFFATFFSILQIQLDRRIYETSNNDILWIRPIANIVLAFCILAYSYHTHPHVRNVVHKYVHLPSRNVQNV